MSSEFTEPNIDELDKIIDILIKKNNYHAEWYFAITSGWDNEEFESLYNDYVKSTQIRITPKDDATTLKGRPLEKIAWYFLKQGGVVTKIREINDHKKWQVDGQGPLRVDSMLKCFGNYCSNFGVQLYLEAKNHKDPIENNDFGHHADRMSIHDCFFGVCISTSGYKISRGDGIAELIHFNFLKKRYHFLLSFFSIYNVLKEEMAPLSVLKNALTYAMNNQFSNDSEIQKFYSSRYNTTLAETEYKRIFGN